MVQLPVAELRMSACFPRQGVPPVHRRSRADGIVIMICYAHAHLCGAQGGEEGEVCFRLMSLTPEHSHQACNEVNRSLTPHSPSAVCSVFRALSDSRGFLLYQSRRSLECMDQVGLYIFKDRSSKCEGKRGELNDTFLTNIRCVTIMLNQHKP